MPARRPRPPARARAVRPHAPTDRFMAFRPAGLNAARPRDLGPGAVCHWAAECVSSRTAPGCTSPYTRPQAAVRPPVPPTRQHGGDSPFVHPNSRTHGDVFRAPFFAVVGPGGAADSGGMGVVVRSSDTGSGRPPGGARPGAGAYGTGRGARRAHPPA